MFLYVQLYLHRRYFPEVCIKYLALFYIISGVLLFPFPALAAINFSHYVFFGCIFNRLLLDKQLSKGARQLSIF